MDPKVLFLDADVNSADVTEYTVPAGEAGGRIMSLSAVNKTTAAITVRVWVVRSAVSYYLAYDASIPPNGFPVFIVTPSTSFYLDASDVIHALASTATGIDMICTGFELKD